MKKISTICAAILMTAGVFLPQQLSAQAPEKMSYQAVVRDGSDNLVTSTTVGMQVSVLQGSSTGTAVYVETQTPASNANGLVSLEIGTGTTSGDFSSIDWANGPYFIKTETDPTGGTSYTITGISQLLSVPYALHAGAVSGGSLLNKEDFYMVGYETASGTNGGAAGPNGQWSKYPLNTIDGFGETDVELNTDTLTFQPGFFKINGYLHMNSSNLTATRLRNISGTTLIASTRGFSGGPEGNLLSELNGVFEVTQPNTKVVMEYYIPTSGAPQNPLGNLNGENSGEANVWGRFTIQKIE